MRSRGRSGFSFFLSVVILLVLAASPVVSSGDICPTCGGRGVIEAVCPFCGGLGYIPAGTIHGQPAAYGCEACGGVRGDPSRGTGRQGTGKFEQVCPTCGGTGSISSPSSTQPPSRTGAAEKAAAEYKAKQEAFEKLKQETVRNMKGVGGGEAKPLDLKRSLAIDFDAVKVQAGVVDPVELRGALLQDLSGTIRERTGRPNAQAQVILKSFRMKEPPSPVKSIVDLAAGDVILVAPVPLKDGKTAGLGDVLVSNSINLLDRWGSDDWSSPASHTALFLGERDGRRWYLDHTSDGPLIMDEVSFLKTYGARRMDVATLVGQPLSRLEGDDLWKAAQDLLKTAKYGPSRIMNFGNNRMVCSEAARWALVRAGRWVPETQNGSAKILGVDTGLNKKSVVSFSPSDFYGNQQYFVIHGLSIQKK